MKTTQIVPGLHIDEELHGIARWEGLFRHAPRFSRLSWERFTTPTNWWLIPARDGTLSRAEFTVHEDAAETVKINVWFMPERPGEKGKPRPHSHPWDFRSHILRGAYYEDQYTLHGDRVHSVHSIGHLHGESHDLPRDVYHEVTGVWEPGRTMSLMMCGRGERGTWGHLNPDTGKHTPSRRDPKFQAHLAALNPHQQ